MNTRKINEKGFTIIEVVLVLAIAALIFLMVFVALPALQANQRDTARKNDVSVIAGAVSSWQGNNRSGSFPTNTQIREYADNVSGNTDLAALTVVAGPTSGSTEYTIADDAAVRVYTEAKCDSVSAEGKVTLSAGTKRQYATVTRLESGNSSGYCLDS